MKYELTYKDGNKFIFYDVHKVEYMAQHIVIRYAIDFDTIPVNKVESLICIDDDPSRDDNVDAIRYAIAHPA